MSRLPSKIPSKVLTFDGEYKSANVQLKKAFCPGIASPFA